MPETDLTEPCVRRYGLLSPKDWGDECDEQLRRMTELWNKLVEIERENRTAYNAATADDPAVIEAEARLAALIAERDGLIEARKAERKAARKAVPTPELDEKIEALKPAIRAAGDAAAAARKAARQRPEVKAVLAKIEAERLAKVKLIARAWENPEAMAAASEVEQRYQAEVRAIIDSDPDVIAAAERLKATDRKDKAAIKAARQALRDARAAAKKVHRDKLLKLRRKRNAEVAPPEMTLWWSNANAVLAAYKRARAEALKKGAELRFRAFRGEGRIVNQIQGRGIPVGAFLTDGHAQIRISAEPLAPKEKIARNGRRIVAGTRRGGGRVFMLTVTVYGEGRQGRRVANFPLVLHRPLPPDGTIKELTVTKARIADRTRWNAVFLLSRPAPTVIIPKGVPVAVNFGWRRLNDGLRVATILRKGADAPEYVVLPEAILKGHARVAECQSDRDGMLNAIMPWAAGLDMQDAPEAVAEAHARMLRAPKPTQRSLARVALAWRKHGQDNPDGQWRPEDFERIVKWLREDRELWKEQEHLRDKLIARRRDLYHNEAGRIVAGACEIRLDNADWAQLARRERPDGSETELWQAARTYRHMAAVGDLGTILKHHAHKAQVPIVTHEGPATWRCHRCGAELAPVRPAALRQTCSHCLTSWDQDVNNVRVRIDPPPAPV